MRVQSLVVVALVALVAIGCERIDRSLVDPAYNAARDLDAAIAETGGAEPALQQALEVHVLALGMRGTSDEEKRVYEALARANVAYRDYLTFRALNVAASRAVAGRIPVSGRTADAAKRYGLPILDASGDGGWVNSGPALEQTRAAAQQALGEATTLLSGR